MLRTMHIHLRTVAALARKKLLQEAAYGIQFAGWFAAPFLYVAPFIFQARFFAGHERAGASVFQQWAGTSEYVAFIAIGAAMCHWVVNILWEIGFTFRDEQEEGTLEQLWLTPAPRWLLALGNSAANSVVNSVTTLTVLLLVHLTFGMSLRVNWLLLTAVSVLSWICLYGLGFVYAGLVVFLRDAQHVVSLGNETLMLLAGATFPLSVLPAWIRGIARLTPLSWVLSALRKVMIEEASWNDLRLEIAVLAAMAAAMPAIGYLVFRAFDAAARKRGTLGGY